MTNMIKEDNQKIDTMEHLEYLCENDESKLIESKYSKLMIAIKNRMPKTIKKLMTTKNLIAFSNDNKNALMIACEFNMEDIAEQIYNTLGHRYLLLENDNDNNDALTFICKNNMKRMFDHVRNTKIKTIRYGLNDNKLNIIEYVNVEKINKDNETLFIIICKNKLNAFGLDLLKDNFDYNLEHQDYDGNTALMYAINNGLQNLAIKIAKKMKNINQVNNENKNAILLSCKRNFPKISLELLKNKKIDLTKIDNDKCTPLIYASMEDNLQVVTEIIKKECNITQIDFQGENALSFAVLNMNETISLVIAKKWTSDFNHEYVTGAGKKKYIKTILMRALMVNMTKLCEFIILSEKYDLGQVDDTNKTLLIHLVERRYKYLAELVLKSNQEINCGHKDNSRTTALIYSAFKDLPTISSLLIKRSDCDPSCFNIDELDVVGHLLANNYEDIIIEMLRTHHKALKSIFSDVHYVTKENGMKKLRKYLQGKITTEYV